MSILPSENKRPYHTIVQSYGDTAQKLVQLNTAACEALRYQPDLTESSSSMSGDIQALAEGATEAIRGVTTAASSLWSWVLDEAEPASADSSKDNQKIFKEVNELKKQAKALEERQTRICEEVNKRSANPDFLNRAIIIYAETHHEWLLNMNEQALKLNQVQQNSIDIGIIETQIQAVEAYIEQLKGPVEPSIVDTAAEMAQRALAAATQLIGDAQNELADVYKQVAGATSETLADMQKELQAAYADIKESTPDFVALMQDARKEVTGAYGKITALSTILSQWTTDKKAEKDRFDQIKQKIDKNEEITDVELGQLVEYLNNAIADKQKISSGTIQGQLTALIPSLMTAHPKIAKVILGVLAVSAGTALGGPMGGIAAKNAVDKIIASFAPDAAPETKAEKIAAGIIEAASTLCIGGKAAAAVSGGSSVMKEVAPKEIQDGVAAAANAHVAHKMGMSAATSMMVGVGSMLALNNLKVFQAIGKDLKHAWTVCKKQPLLALPKLVFFLKDQLTGEVLGVRKAVGEGKYSETVTRVGVAVLGAFGIIYSLGGAPFAIALFYLVNKTYEFKYEGPAHIKNPSFKAYVMTKYKESGKTGKELFDILEQENESHKTLRAAFDEVAVQ